MCGAEQSLPTLDVIPWAIGEPVPPLVRRLDSECDRPLVLCVDRRQSASAAAWRKIRASLSRGEVVRYSSYRNPADAERFLVGRGLLRSVLGCVSATPAARVSLRQGLTGKPCCLNGPEFNVSHSGDLVLIALHPSLAVGVDVEADVAPCDWESIARRVLTPQSLRAVLSLPRQRQGPAFLEAWCHLEAQVKLIGTGFGGAATGRELPPTFRQWTLVLPRGYRGSVATASLRRPTSCSDSVHLDPDP
jgi:4'-phosphopantetheinyl transferase